MLSKITGQTRANALRPLWCGVLLAIIVAGCAQPKPVGVPTPSPAPPRLPPVKKELPPPPAPVKKEPPPPPLLSPEMGEKEDNRLKQEARAKIAEAERLVRQIDQRKLGKEQQETFLTIQSFLSKAKDALSVEDSLRAFNLADKAFILAQDLLQATR